MLEGNNSEYNETNQVRRSIKRLRSFDARLDLQLPDQQFIEHYRFSRVLFEELCRNIGGKLVRKDSNFRKNLSVREMVACFLYRIGHVGENINVAQLFGLGHSTLTKIMRECSDAIISTLDKEIILSNCQLNELNDSFSFPGCVLAIDGSHIPIKKPPGKNTDFLYFNRKRFLSIILFAAVDGRKLFKFVEIGRRGRKHDSSIFEQSSLRIWLRNCSKDKFYYEDLQLKPLIIGVPAFRLDCDVMKPYPSEE
ncbi:hypothetical protein SNEBB_002166, partial [Seison nebaliae]